MERVIVGAVGVLQFEVLDYRIKNEYGCDLRRMPLPYQQIRWIKDQSLDPKRSSSLMILSGCRT